MNKKMIKRVAVASLAALMTIPNITTINYAEAKITRWEDGTYKSASFDNNKEALEFYKKELAENGNLYNEFRTKSIQKQIERLETSIKEAEERAESREAKKAEDAAKAAQKAAEKAAAEAAKKAADEAAKKAAEEESQRILEEEAKKGPGESIEATRELAEESKKAEQARIRAEENAIKEAEREAKLEARKIEIELKTKANYNLANAHDLSQISQVKLITDYSNDTVVNLMDTVIFGSYPQSDANGNTKDPIEWIVLDRQGNKALLLSKYVLDVKPYNEIRQDITWENCTLRQWLNSTFLNTAFSNDEQNCIQVTDVINKGLPSYTTPMAKQLERDYGIVNQGGHYPPIPGGNNTNDKLFILSQSEFEKYFTRSALIDYPKIATIRTDYAQNRFVQTHTEHSSLPHMCSYMLRTPSYDGPDTFQCISNGYMGSLLGLPVDDAIGIRPAMWITY